MTAKPKLSTGNAPSYWQEPLANLVAKTPLRHLLAWAVQLIVPRTRVGVGIVALAQDEVLLLRHVFHPHAPWGLPGGWLGRREDPAHGALRELREETGLEAELGPMVFGRYESRPPHIGLAYLAHVKPGEMRLSGEIIEAAWFPVGHLPVPLQPFVARSIEAALAWSEEGREQRWAELR